MSFQAMTWAVEQKCDSAGQKLVLLMLSNYCNSHTGQCNPSHQRLANECCMGASTLKRHLSSLADNGLIEIIPRSNDGVSLPNQYLLKLDGVGPNRAGGGSKSGWGMGPNRATNQEDKPVIEPEELSPAYADDAPAASIKRKQAVTLNTWLHAMQEKGEQAIPADDPIFSDADRIGLPSDYLRICWMEFRDRYRDGDRKAKRYADWRATFRNAVRDNWFKLWAINADGECFLTTQGTLAMRRFKGGDQ